jgi:hypothetical protein
MYFSSLFSPAPPAGRASHAAVAHVAMTRSTDVKYSLKFDRSPASEMSFV